MKITSIIILSFLFFFKIASGTHIISPPSTLFSATQTGQEQDTTLVNKLVVVDSFNLKILPPSLGIQFYKNSIIFLSQTKNEVNMLPDFISFGAVEAYFATPSDSGLAKHEIFSGISAFVYPCDGVSFSNDFNTMYFSKISPTDGKEKIYMANYTTDVKNHSGWVMDPYPLEFCKDNFVFSHPALSADGQELIFASDMKNSLGGMDLFIVRKTGNSWSVPENLGNKINTPGNEFFPFLDKENNLYFSSDGLPGYGGFDVFTSRVNGKNWDSPINLSRTINSENDDIAFTINKIDGKTAFFTRRQISDKRIMQLFRVTLNNITTTGRPLTISDVFESKIVKKGNSALSISDFKTDTVKVLPEDVLQGKKEIKKAASPDSALALTKTSTPSVAPEVRKEKKVVPKIQEAKDIVEYRVQIMTSPTKKANFDFTVSGKTYVTEEYYYLKAYRYTIGRFRTLASAVELQNICRKNGHPQAFVVAFKNNKRSVDPALFK